MRKRRNGILLRIGIALIAIVVITVFSAGGFYMLVGWRLDAAESEIEQIELIDLIGIEDEIAFHDDRIYETEKEVFGLKKEFGNLAEKVDRNFKNQQDFQIEQRTMQKEIIKEIKELHE